MRKLLVTAAALAMMFGSGAAYADSGISIVFTHHSSAANTFWQAVKKGFEDACGKIDAHCQMVFTQNEGSIDQQVANMQAAIASNPTALLTTVVDANAYSQVLADARAKGVLVIAVNVDALVNDPKAIPHAFIGQGFVAAGHALGKALGDKFPAEGPIKVMVGVSAPGQSWSEQRAAGVMQFLDEYKAAHPERQVTYEKMDSGTDIATVADRVGAYLNANPDTTAYYDTGYWVAGLGRVLQDRGVAPGKYLLGGFDVVPDVLTQVKAGYVQAVVDQQPYMQGFMPVMEVYLNHEFGLSTASINTGEGIVTEKDADQIMSLSAKGIR
jgi:simple sugar transport system substrate-binding protein